MLDHQSSKARARQALVAPSLSCETGIKQIALNQQSSKPPARQAPVSLTHELRAWVAEQAPRSWRQGSQ
jgi:hypothetical protein